MDFEMSHSGASIALAGIEDAKTLNELVSLVYGDTYGIKSLYNENETKELLQAGLEKSIGGMTSFIASIDSCPAGFGSILKINESEFELCRTMVLKEFRGSNLKLGQKLVQARINFIEHNSDWGMISSELRAAEPATQHNCMKNGLGIICGIFPAFAHLQEVEGKKLNAIEFLIDAFKINPKVGTDFEPIFASIEAVPLIENLARQLNLDSKLDLNLDARPGGKFNGRFAVSNLAGNFSVISVSNDSSTSIDFQKLNAILDAKTSGATIAVLKCDESGLAIQKLLLPLGFSPCSVKPIILGDKIVQFELKLAKMHSFNFREVRLANELNGNALIESILQKLALSEFAVRTHF